MAYDIKKLLQEREKHYIKKTEELLLGFFEPLKNALQTVVYDGEKTQIVIKSITPIAQNLNYVNIVISAANYDIGDLLPVKSEDKEELIKTVQVTEDNFWSFVDTINLNVPISVLETQDEATITEFMEEIYEKDIPIPDEGEDWNPEAGTDRGPVTVGDLLSGAETIDGHQEFEKTLDDLDEVQKKTLDLYRNKGTVH